MTGWVQLRITPPMSRPGFARDGGAPAARELRLPGGGEIRIGRRAGVEVELPYATVSLLHAALSPDGDGLLLTDLGSRNGTWFAGERLPAGERRRLAPGQSFKAADVEISLLAGGAEEPPAETTASIARRLVADMFRTMDGGGVPSLCGEGQSGVKLSLSESDRRYLVGRGDECALVLLDDSVSREHAAFERRWEGVFVLDLGSKNGVSVGGQPIAGERRLRDGDLIAVGGVVLRLDDPQDRFLREIEQRPEVEAKPAEGAPANGGGVEAVEASGDIEAAPVQAAVVAPRTEPHMPESWLGTRAILLIAGAVLLAVGGLLTWILVAA